MFAESIVLLLRRFRVLNTGKRKSTNFSIW